MIRVVQRVNRVYTNTKYNKNSIDNTITMVDLLFFAGILNCGHFGMTFVAVNSVVFLFLGVCFVLVGGKEGGGGAAAGVAKACKACLHVCPYTRFGTAVAIYSGASLPGMVCECYYTI